MPPKINNRLYKILIETFENIEDIISINNIPFVDVDKNKIKRKDIIEYKCQKKECNETNKKTIKILNEYGCFCKNCTINKKMYDWNKILSENFENINDIISINNIPFNEVDKKKNKY